MSKTHSGTLHAWLSKHRSLEGLSDSTDQEIVGALTISNDGPGKGSYWEDHGYTYLGAVEVKLTLESRDRIIANKIESLKVSKKRVLAEAQKAATEIEREIQTLLAIPCEVQS